jgi:cytochrome c556
MPDYGKEYATNGATAKKWSELSDVMKQGSDDLIAAVKAKDLKGLAQAAGKLNQSCNGCHTAFR